MKIKLKRAQIGKAPGLDITVKSAQGFAQAFAPTWDMVMGHKSGELSDNQYSYKYTQILMRGCYDPVKRSHILLHRHGQENGGEVTLLCYCSDGKFCHTHLMIDWLTEQYPDLFEDARPITSSASSPHA